MAETAIAPPPAPSSPTETEQDIKDLASGALVNFIGKLGRLSRGAFIWVVTLLCGLEVQGLFSLVWTIVSTLHRVGRFGLHLGVVRLAGISRVAGRQEQAERVLAAALLLGGLASSVVVVGTFVAAEWIAASCGKPIAPALRIMALSTPFMTWAWIFVSATRALRIMRYDVYVMSVGGPLVLLAGGVAVGLAGWGLEGLCWAHLVMAVCSCWLAAHYFGRFFSLRSCLGRLRQDLPWQATGRFSLPVMATDVLYGVLSQADVLMVGWFFAAEQVGVYAIARNIAGAMLKAPQSLDPIFSSIISELSAREQHQEMGARFAVISGWILTINLPIFAGILLVGDELLNLMSGAQAAHFQAGMEVLVVLGAGMMVQGICAMVDPVLTMAGRPYLNLFNNGLWLGATFLLNLWLIREHGLVGAAWGTALATVLVGGLRLGQLYLIHDILPFRRSQFKSVLAALGGGLAGWLCRELLPTGTTVSMILPLAGFLGTYVALLRLLGLGPEEQVLVQRARQIFWRKR